MVHVFEFVHETQVFVGAVVVLYEGLFEIHNVVVRGLLGSVDLDGSEILVVSGLD